MANVQINRWTRAGRESDKDQMVGKYATSYCPAWARAYGWRRARFSRSLGLVMGLLFITSWTAQFIAGRSEYNAEQLMGLQAPSSGSEYHPGSRDIDLCDFTAAQRTRPPSWEPLRRGPRNHGKQRG